MDPHSIASRTSAAQATAVSRIISQAITSAADNGMTSCTINTVPRDSPSALAFFAQFTSPAYDYEWRDKMAIRPKGCSACRPEDYYLWVSWANSL